jgi:hypothetical protein
MELSLAEIINSPWPENRQIKAPDHTQQEGRYLQRLADERIPVRVRLSDNQEVEGLISSMMPPLSA